MSQGSPAAAEGGPFVPPPDASAAKSDDASAEKLAAIEALSKTLPIAAPLAHYELGSRFGPRIDPFNHRAAFHTGIDMDAPYSSPVYATAPGTVIYAGWLGDYGQAIEIDHGYGIVTLYGHLRRCLVAVGQTVSAQTEIGLLGSTGRSTGPHVHYEVRVDGQPQDPQKFLSLAHLLPATSDRQVTPAVGGPAGNSR
jgi:murein DD-endopeptidase MepM/ murein hydrolase activator NlpD